ncbi:MAG: peptide chain release factor N(5)-glutamine methyltransferase [Oscillospiraceae bacterium]|jgi:release factor glutamine methyltransferase|nr:peptide chain release factor N(5)-glutamine methyltransferase [Oscillospiraceae bacterium]
MVNPETKKEQEAAVMLKGKGNNNPRLEARWLAEHAKRTGADLFSLVERRLSNEPLQYILGEWEFYGNAFYVGEGVLIPRQETERLVDVALCYIESQMNPTPIVADLCAGSGCVGLSIANRVDSNVFFVESQRQAAQYLVRNIDRYGLGERTETHFCSVFSQKLHKYLASPPFLADVIVANPPYLTSDEMNSLQPEVQREPIEALYGGYDGLTFYRHLFRDWKRYLVQNGLFAVEVGNEQADAVAELMKQAGFPRPIIHNDYVGIKRVVSAVNVVSHVARRKGRLERPTPKF